MSFNNFFFYDSLNLCQSFATGNEVAPLIKEKRKEFLKAKFYRIF